MNTPTDYDILNWLEVNIRNILITVNYLDYEDKSITFQRMIRRGKGDQAIYSEREYSTLREMATDALQKS